RRTTRNTPLGGPRRVLTIDDDPQSLELIAAILEPEGYVVLRATTGTEGIMLAQREQPSLVMLDLLLPEMDGFEVVERLRANPATASLPVVILTSRTMTPADGERLNGQISYLARKGGFPREAFVELVRGL